MKNDMGIFTIREQPHDSQNEYKAIVIFNHEDELSSCTIRTHRFNVQVADLEWYFDEYTQDAEDEDRANQVTASLKEYGQELFKQVFCGDALRRYDSEKTGIQCVEITGSPAFHSLHWETLYDPNEQQPLVLDIPIIRKYLSKTRVKLESFESSPTINLLIVAARPDHKEIEIKHRTISRPLVESLRQAELWVKIDIVRPATYRALRDHLAKKTGYYHIIHFDVHGKLQDKQAFLLFESDKDNEPEPIEATQLAKLLVRHQIPITILNACESGKQVGITETSLSGQFMQAGMPMVLAMRYTVTADAATLFMGTLYKYLFDKPNDDIATAIHFARSTLYDDKTRHDNLNQAFEIEDWIIPVVYQNTTVSLPIRDFTPEEKKEYGVRTFHCDPNLPYKKFVGRDFDISQIESKLRQDNILLIQGESGIGKTALLHHLGWWWQNTGFINEVFYFGYDEEVWAHQQVLLTLAEKLFDANDNKTFEPLSLGERRSMVANHLCKKRHLLIFDALGCIDESEKTALHDFLMGLVGDGDKTLVLLGSQTNERWLAAGTFMDNVYKLSGIDNESALTLITSALSLRGKNPFIYQLLNKLKGHPLLLKIIVQMIARQKKQLLIPLLKNNILNEEKKSQTILMAVFTLIFNTLSSAEKGLLLCLAPFKSAININTLSEYSQRLRQQPVLAQLPLASWATQPTKIADSDCLKKMANWGLLRFTPDNILLQSALVHFLRYRLHKLANWRSAIETTFQQYFDKTSETVSEPVMAKQPLKPEQNKLSHQTAITAIKKTGSPIKVYPIVATENIDEEDAKDASLIPICIHLSYQKGQYRITPKISGSLKDLHEYLRDLFKIEKQNTGLQFELDLTADVVHPLNAIVNKYYRSKTFDKIVICCPLHYIRYMNANKWLVPREASELLKLIYVIDCKAELDKCDAEDSIFSELSSFYSDCMEDIQKDSANIKTYKTIDAVAQLWFQHVQSIAYHQKASQPSDECTY
jgi:hypothetical protein